DAAAKTVLCCAGIHTLILAVYVVTRGDASAFNVFTMLEAQRLWPGLATAPAAPWWSFLALLALYGAVYGLLATDHSPVPRDACAGGARERSWLSRFAASVRVPAASAAIVAPGFAQRAPASGAALAAPHEVTDARSFVSSLFHFRPSLRDGVLMLLGGLALHMASLAGIERFVSVFPPVPDVLHTHLPYVDFGPPGEMVYAAFLVTIVTVLVKRQPHSLPSILFLLGVFYGLRGVFLFVLPLGMPPTAPPLEARFVLWPFAGHAYFPGGHTGMMTVLSLSVVSRSWRRAFLVATFAFAFGTLLSRTHYTADALGGWCIGYAIVLWGRRHVVMRPASHSAKQATGWSPVARREQEV
ncbi:MAG TPA: hypothetical protein VFX50_18960, partial [Gemmatimonadales bacterium]|nr:hypothetical protein [Gemmatimonadales bacterium]